MKALQKKPSRKTGYALYQVGKTKEPTLIQVVKRNDAKLCDIIVIFDEQNQLPHSEKILGIQKVCAKEGSLCFLTDVPKTHSLSTDVLQKILDTQNGPKGKLLQPNLSAHAQFLRVHNARLESERLKERLIAFMKDYGPEIGEIAFLKT